MRENGFERENKRDSLFQEEEGNYSMQSCRRFTELFDLLLLMEYDFNKCSLIFKIFDLFAFFFNPQISLKTTNLARG